MANKVILIGRLGRDPERVGQDGQTVILSLATESPKKQDNVKKTEWHRCVLFNNNAQNALQYLRKGSQVYLEGTISTSEYTDRNGNNRQSKDIIVYYMELLGGTATHNNGQGEHFESSSYQQQAPTAPVHHPPQQPPQRPASYQPQQPPQQPAYGNTNHFDDDIPF